MKEESYADAKKYERLYTENWRDKAHLATIAQERRRSSIRMVTEKPVTTFLNGVGYLVATSERYVDPKNVDEYHTAMQARSDAEALIDHTQQTLMYLMQRLKKLPPLPDIKTIPYKDGWDKMVSQQMGRDEQHV